MSVNEMDTPDVSPQNATELPVDFCFELSRSWLACLRPARRVPPSAISVLRKRSRRRAAACAALTTSRDACRHPQLPIAATIFNAPKTCKRIRESSARYSTFKPTLRADTAAFVSCRACSERPRDDSRRAIFAHAVLMLSMRSARGLLYILLTTLVKCVLPGQRLLLLM